MSDFHDYADILKLTRPVSKYPKMAREARAAQFASFAALSGHEDAINETARLTDKMLHLDDNSIELLNAKLCAILECADQKPTAVFTHFVKDEKKQGGAYVKTEGIVSKIDEIRKVLILEDKTKIPIESISDIESPLFLKPDLRLN